MATATAPAPARQAGPAPGGGALVGMGTLVAFQLRRDRLRLLAWLAGLTLLSVATALSFEGLYPTAADRQGTAATMDSPAGLAMTGPRRYLDDYTIGSMMSHQMLGFVAVLVALMSIFAVVRNTRAEEETGRAELVRAAVVGRHAHLGAALAVAVGANVALALLIAVSHGSLGIEGMPWGGSLLYGAAHGAVGVTFAGLAALTAQVTEHARGASGAAAAVVGAAYVARAVGDAATPWLSWLSPIGWAQASYAYVDDRWWPLLLCVVAGGVLAAAALWLSTRRDVGAGMRAARAGRSTAGPLLGHPVGLVLRLQRSVLIGFLVALALTGLAYGSFLADVEELLANIEGADEIVAAMGGATLVDSFLSLTNVVMAILSSVFVVLVVLRVRSEEDAGRAELLLSTPLRRRALLGSHLAVAVGGGAVLLVAAALGMGLAGAASTGDGGVVGTALGAAAVHLPAQWVTAGVAVALVGWLPRAAALAWLVPGYAFLVGYLGEILQFPAWAARISPFSVVPHVPAEELSWTPLLGLAALAGALVLLGVRGLDRRDVGSA